MRRVIRVHLAVFLIVAFVAGTGCATDESEPGLKLSDTLQYAGPLVLEKVATVGSEPGPIIGTPKDVVVDGYGRVYVADSKRTFIWVLSPRGDSIDVIGRRGRGPGEFKRLSSLVVGPSDSLFVLDTYRVSAFSPDSSHSFAYSFRLPPSRNRTPSEVYPMPSGTLLARYTRPKNPNLGTPGHWIMRVSRSGEILKDSLLYMPLEEKYVREPELGHLRAVTPPRARRSVFAYNPHRRCLCYGWTDSLHVRCLSSNETVTAVLNIAHAPLPVTEKEIHQSRETFTKEAVSMIEEEGWHDTHPAFRGMLIDREGRFWIQESARVLRKRDTYPWHVINAEEKTFRSTRLRALEAVRAATQKYVYTTRVRSPIVSVYRIETKK